MEILRVENELWQRAGVHYVRVAATNKDLGAPLELEFQDDRPDSKYILILEDIYPVFTCRLAFLDGEKAQIERVATVPEYQGQGYGRIGIQAAEDWLKELGYKEILINSRVAVEAFYEKLGYVSDPETIEGEGNFVTVQMKKYL